MNFPIKVFVECERYSQTRVMFHELHKIFTGVTSKGTLL